MVTNINDSGPCSLRQAISDASPGGIVEISVSGTLRLTSPLVIDKPLTLRLSSSSAGACVLDGGGSNRLFHITAGPTTISGLILSNGWDFFEGGGVYNDAELLVERCRIVNCSARLMGGGIANGSGARCRVTGSEIARCGVNGSGAGAGGGAVINYGRFVADSSAFHGNWAAYYPFQVRVRGGAVCNEDGHASFTNCTFTSNIANNDGGAIATLGGSLTLVHCTIANNQRYYSSGYGGGIYNGGSELYLFNSIVANSFTFREDVYGFVWGGDYNLIERTNVFSIPGTHNLYGIDPVLDSLKDNGGTTLTMALGGISPAIDAASSFYAPSVDQRGISRPIGGAPDIGAFEGALPTNHAPVVENSIPDLPATYGQSVNYPVPAKAFSDPDAGQTLTYTIDAFTHGWWFRFDSQSLTFTGTVASVGTYPIQVIATDNGVPPLSVTNTFQLIVPKVPITASVRSAVRPVGVVNPSFEITYHGLIGPEWETVDEPPLASTPATSVSPPGTYPITLSGGFDNFYEFAGLTNGTLRVLDFSANYRVLHSFGFTNKLGHSPGNIYEGMGWIRGSDGRLYGTTKEGGYGGIFLAAAGVVFHTEADGTGYQVLHHFGDYYPGAKPNALVEASDGVLYGTTTETAPGSQGGTLFKLNKDGSGFRVLKHFFEEQSPGFLITATNDFLYGLVYQSFTNILFRIGRDGSNYTAVRAFNPFTEGRCMGVIQASDGWLYGITARGSGGAVFKIQLDGSGFTTVYTDANWESLDQMTLREGSDGVLYGTALYGASFAGSIFKLNKDGTSYAELMDFANPDHGLAPVALLEGVDGKLYGAADSGGTNSYGTLFRLNKDGTGFTVLHHLGASFEPQFPTALVQGEDGRLFSASRGGNGSIFTVSTNGVDFDIIWNFSSTGGDGAFAGPPVIEASDGKLYGTTHQGGEFNAGSVYRLNKDGSGYELLRHFNGEDGSVPRAGLLEASDGVLYGSAKHGGADSAGVIFRMNRDGSAFTTLHEFEGPFGFPEGRWPVGALIEGTNGSFYGLSEFGGANNRGTLFKLSRDGADFSVLHDFTLAEQTTETSGLLLGSDGMIYGTATADLSGTNGVVFRIQHDGSGYTVLRDFTVAIDGTRPVGALIEISNVIFGVTSAGGEHHRGTVFRMNMDGAGYQVLRHLGDGTFDVRLPYGGLRRGPDGALYGTATEGGSFGGGAVFRLRMDGSDYCVIHDFYGNIGDGYYPRANLVTGADGSLYGTTAGGGMMNLGTVLTIGLTRIGNVPPVLVNPFPDRTNAYGGALSFTFAANTFHDPDAGQLLSYSASNLPPGISFDGSTRIFTGTPTTAGLCMVTVTATDDGVPSLSTNATFNFAIAPAPLTVTANNAARFYGQDNPTFTGSIMGVVNGDAITASFVSSATELSPPGDYVITALLDDPNARLGNYFVTTNLGILTVVCSTNLMVTTTAYEGPGSLREAIILANESCATGAVLISFNIPGPGVHTIAPLTALPIITHAVTIDGYTQPGSSPNSLPDADNAVLRIELTGASLGEPAYGLWITASSSTVRGLVINRFTPGVAGILLQNSDGHVVEGCFIGTDATGTNRLGNATGIQTINAGFRAGGTTTAARNVIGGNEVGLGLNSSAATQVQGNFVGLAANGLSTVSNVWGLYLQDCQGAQIGGAALGSRNIISGNANGCWINGGAGNVLRGNFVGTDASGSGARGNIFGIVMNDAASNLIGDANAGNVISGNSAIGLVIQGTASISNVVAGNFIGTASTGLDALGNGDYGVFVSSTGNRIGGVLAGEGNVISGNSLYGVGIYGSDTTNVAVLGNSIFGNGSLDLDLGANSATANDPADADDGPNHLQNFPQIDSAMLGGGNLEVSYRVDSASTNSSYPMLIEFFLADASGERTLIHRSTYATPQAATNLTFLPLAPVGLNNQIVATATDANGNTSEFSAPAPVPVAASVPLSISSSDNVQTISWPTAALGFVLESTDSLSPPVAWQAITNGISDDGMLRSYFTTNTLGGSNRFFRLKWQ